MEIRRRHPNPPVDVASLRYQTKLPEVQANHILEKIVWHKEIEVAKLREAIPLLELRKQAQNLGPTRDFWQAIAQSNLKPALIAEVKKASPSKGIICANFDPVAIALEYQRGNATCISVLTDKEFFQGSFEYLQQIRQAVTLPLLCKEFILYPYQIYLARCKGADAVLLIASILKDQDLQYLLKIIKSLGMTALVEVHTLEELDRVLKIPGVNLIGINNRNLEDFSVDLNTTTNLLELRGSEIKKKEILVVSESGLYDNADIQRVQQAGATAILVGESLVKQASPAEAIAKLYQN
ncbi:indole-3-glycerol phosphate synthase TrpC [Gloeocapsa sp. PCC 73106]|uniref:indole-3-glycerol phosphate synthase TrpC n=1 Tax=Gloeocapsa sp. PCC 73106 TaxID=102232 RepID=UPI0002AC34CF|nr:indole-3-glycerol phosphate synthase TrpC [Gloeocapsa sp. PCC 73106]ELR99812.1 Indole-3-glycerol phosphate synthase [Gloeocapsa sp. PCC 73106]